jgi:hypothetical protein
MQSRGVDHAASDIVRHRRSVFERMSSLELSPKRLVQNRDAHVEERLEGPFRQAGRRGHHGEGACLVEVVCDARVLGKSSLTRGGS